MNHSFNVEFATKHGIECAVLYENILFWVLKNKANNKHFHNGMYWTYNSAKAFNELFPYISSRSIIRHLNYLCARNLIIKGNFNDKTTDRTLWYTICQNGNMDSPKWQMQIAKMANDIYDTNINTDINTDIKQDFANLQNFDNLNDNLVSDTNTLQAKENLKIKEKSCEKKEIPTEWQEIINIWLEYKRKRKQTYKDEDSIFLFYKKLLRLSFSNLEIARQIIEDSMANNYSGIFAPKNISAPKSSPQGGGEITQVEL